MRQLGYAYKPPYFMTAKYRGTCPETGDTIRPGDEIAYDPVKRKAYSGISSVAAAIRAHEARLAADDDDIRMMTGGDSNFGSGY